MGLSTKLALLADKLSQFHDWHRPASVNWSNGGHVQVQPLDLVIQRHRVGRRSGRRRRVGRSWTVRVRFHEYLRLRQIDERVLLGMSIAAGGVDLDRLPAALITALSDTP